jgi:hypothetical protein
MWRILGKIIAFNSPNLPENILSLYGVARKRYGWRNDQLNISDKKGLYPGRLPFTIN